MLLEKNVQIAQNFILLAGIVWEKLCDLYIFFQFPKITCLYIHTSCKIEEDSGSVSIGKGHMGHGEERRSEIKVFYAGRGFEAHDTGRRYSGWGEAPFRK